MPTYKKKTYQNLINVLLISIIVITLFSLYKCQIDSKENNKIENKNKENIQKNKEDQDGFLDYPMHNPPIVNGKYPRWYRNLQKLQTQLLPCHQPPKLYPSHSTRSQEFYNQGLYPNMSIPPQTIGCGGRRMPCYGGTQETIPVIPPPIEISERNIAPVNVFTRPLNPTDAGVIHQVGVLYKIFGNENEIYPLYGVRRYRNSDSWDYSTKIGREGNFVYVRVRTKHRNNNELQTNDEVTIDGHNHKYRVTIYDNDFSEYVPHIRL